MGVHYDFLGQSKAMILGIADANCANDELPIEVLYFLPIRLLSSALYYLYSLSGERGKL